MKRAYTITILAIILLFSSYTSSLSSPQTTEPSSPSPDTPESPTDTETSIDALDKPTNSISTELYHIIEEDGICYLNFKNGNELSEQENSLLATTLGSISFTSVDDMCQAFYSGKLTAEQIAIIKTFASTEKGLQIPANIQNPDIPLLPEGYQYGSVIMTERDCSIAFTAPANDFSGWAFFYDFKQYNALYEYEYANYYENNLLQNISLSSDIFGNIPCEVGTFTTQAASLKTIRFEVETDEKEISVIMQYCLESYNGLMEESDTVPYSIMAFYEHNGKYGVFYLSDIPTVDTSSWLDSFGITSYSSAT